MLKKEAAELFAEGFNCSQSVFSVFAEKYGLPKETALKIGCGFGGGMPQGGGQGGFGGGRPQ